MAIENEHDEQIKNLLENDYPLKAITVDFNDINNMNLVIRSSFKRAANYIDAHTNEKDIRDNWFYIAELNLNVQGIKIVGLVRMTLTAADGYLKIDHLEENHVFYNQGYDRKIIDYLIGYSKFKHLKGIILTYNETVPDLDKDLKLKTRIYEDKGFKKNEGTLTYKLDLE